MYINNIHILYYVALIFLGIITGQLTDWAIKRMPEYKKVFSKDIFKEYKKEFKPNYILIAINCIINVALLYILGWNNTSLVSNTELIKYLIITPMLLTAFVIDYKLQIIPNKLNLTLLEVGIIFMLINGIFDINMAVNMLLGMVTGAGIFLLITWIGSLIAGKEAMGFGDVKLMGALGLLFGFQNIIAIAVMSFLIGAILSIFLLVTKIKKMDEYIPFGPFIILATFIAMVVPFDLILFVLLKIFTLGMYKA